MRQRTKGLGSTLSPSARRSPPRRVLLAEADAATRSIIAGWLTSGGHTVVVCPTPEELTDNLLQESRRQFTGDAHESFDLIITDLHMPRRDGLDALENLWALPLPPVILITAYGDEETRERAERLDVAAVLFKPFNYSDLMITADWVVKRRQT